VVADERCDDSLADDRRAAAVAYLESTYPNGATPGASVLVTCEGETVFAYNAGMADIEWQQPISSNTRFRLGSISKPLTAVAVLQLVEQGRIELDTQISAYVPNLPDYMRAVTVRQLLSHTSGLPDILLTPALLPLARDWVSVQQVIGMQGKTPPRFAPGEQYDYSNFNYVLIAALIEAVEETSYGDFMDEDVFSRLGLLRSSYDSRLSILPERAQGYDTSPFGELLHSENIDASHTSAAGALLSSANDLGTWASLLMSGELLQADTLAEAWTATVLPNGEATSYGLGFNIAIENSRRVIWHNGLSSGFQAAFSMYPDHGLVVIVLSNSFYLPNTTAAMDRVAAIVLE
jgi:CubicO group peptidase (beta-lactamase class C family)